MTSKYVNHYTEENNVGNITFTDKQLTLTSDGMIALTDNLEEISYWENFQLQKIGQYGFMNI